MSQRLDNQAPLLVIDGKPIFQLRGAEGEGGDGGQGTGSQSGQQGGSGQSSGTDQQQGQGQGTQSGTGQGTGAQSGAGDTVSRAEFDALMARMQAADRAKSAAEQRLQEIDNAGKSELEKAQAELATANKRIEELTNGQRDMLTNNSFLTVKDSPTWHDPAVALKLLDRSLLTYEEDGTVKGMEAAVKKLADSHPYLVKTAEQQSGQGAQGAQGNQGGSGQASGTSNNGSGAGSGKGPDRAAIARKYPALRGR